MSPNVRVKCSAKFSKNERFHCNTWWKHFEGQSEPAPTSAPMWMDGALMGAPFSSLPVPGLTKVANSSLPYSFSFPQPRFVFLGELFFFLTPHACPGLTYLHLDYLPMHPGLLPPPPTHPSIYLPTHLPTFPSTYIPTCLCTKSTPSQPWWKSMKVLQYTK
jgi:hypothetical protein